jgi:hypothetical protein
VAEETTKCSNCPAASANQPDFYLSYIERIEPPNGEMQAYRSDFHEDHPATSIVARRELSSIALDPCGSSCLHAIDADMLNLRKAKLSQ